MPGVPAAVRGGAGRSRSAVSRRAGSPRQVVLHYDALFAAELVRAAALGALLDAALRSGGAAAVGTARVLRHTARGECGRAARGPAALGGCGAARPRRRPPFPFSSQRRSPAQRCSPAPTASPALWERTGTPRARPSATATTAATTACARTPAAAARSAGGYRPPSPSAPRRPACPPLSAPRVRAGAPRAATFGSWGCAASGE